MEKKEIKYEQKTKLVATIMAMCMVITLGVIGIFAVKTLNMSVGGNIVFNAEGLAFEVSAGEFKTTSNATYSNITSQTGKLQGFEMDTNTKLESVQDKIDSWTGLELVATETLGDPVLHFTITNNMPDEILSINSKITLGTNTNDNMEITMTPAVANIAYGTPQAFAITFHIKDTTINAGLQGFTVAMDIGTALVVEESQIQNMTFAPTTGNASKYAISNCTSATGDVVIPHYVTVDNTTYPVTEIADNAFKNNTNITSITIPNTVTKIGDNAFNGCYVLAGELAIPNGVITIGDYAFFECYNFTGDLIIPNSVITIGDFAFTYCGFNGKLVLGNNVETIGGSAFAGTKFTGKLTIGNNVTEIKDCAFESCTGFTGGLTIPDSVVTIGYYAFNECSGFSGNLTIGSSVITICDSAFSGCYNLTGNLTVPNSVETIGNGVFSGCSNLTGDLIIGNGVKSIGGSAFSGAGFENITIGNSVLEIFGDAFFNCSKIDSITILATTPPQYIESCFDGDYPIFVPSESVNAYKTAERWLEYASRIYAIGEQPIMQIDSSGQITNSTDSRYTSVEYQINTSTGTASVFSGDVGDSTEIIIVDKVSYNGTVYNVDTISRGLFSGNLEITKVTIPDSVTTIEEQAFYNCTSLEEVIIGSGVTYFLDLTFSDLRNLTSVTILTETPPIVYIERGGAFDGLAFITIYVPSSSVSAYKSAEHWMCF